MREITPHPEQQRTYAELRSEFRTANQERIHVNLLVHPLGWGVLGDPDKSRLRFTSEEWGLQMLFHLDSPVDQDFGLSSIPFTVSCRLEDLAQKALLHDSVTWEEGEDQDAPACQDVTTMTDEQLCNYVNQSIEESARGSL